jgi:tRNA(Arg) A34 adenosine deaminase TadA
MTSRRQVLSGLLGVGAASALVGCGSSDPSASVPSPKSTSSASDAQEATELALWMAGQAARDGSYGIGGALMETATGRVLQTMPNRVFAQLAPGQEDSPVFVWDPTAHGERQLMTWYLAQSAARDMPPPEALTLVTTVDPCLMCASSLLEVGVSVGAAALDPYSGIDYTQNGQFLDLPEPLRSRARQRFGYFAVHDLRSYQGGPDAAYVGQSIQESTFNDCLDLYISSADTVRAARRSQDTSVDKLQNPATFPSAVPIVRAFAAVSPGAFTVTLDDPRRPDEALRDLLEATVRAMPGSTNACAFVDPFGNVLSVSADQQQVNALNTAFALCTRTYAQTRFALMADPKSALIADQTLTNPDLGTFVWLTAPDVRTAVGMFDVGAYGSTLGMPCSPLIPSAFQYFDLPDDLTADDLQRAIYPLPPLYSSHIAISPQQVAL